MSLWQFCGMAGPLAAVAITLGLTVAGEVRAAKRWRRVKARYFRDGRG
jgi:hypothetical protein